MSSIFDITSNAGITDKIKTLDPLLKPYPANIYLFKVNKRNTRKRSEICLKLTAKIPEQRE